MDGDRLEKVVWIFFIMVLVIGLSVRFLNPHLTETELLIEFWYIWILFIVGAILLASKLETWRDV